MSVERALKDYGVVVTLVDADTDDYAIDEEATASARAAMRRDRLGWLSEDAESVAERYRAGELNELDLIRQYGVIVDWGTGQLFPKTTGQFRDMLRKRAAAYWTAA